MSKRAVVAEVELSKGLLDTIQSLARELHVSDEEVLTSSVNLMNGVARGRFRVTELNGVSEADAALAKKA